MRYLWSEAERLANLSKHDLDFADAEKVFARPQVLFEDVRGQHPYHFHAKGRKR